MPQHRDRDADRHQARVTELVARTDTLCHRHLDDEYAVLSRRALAQLALHAPSVLERGGAAGLAGGVVHAVGWANFLDDPGQTPHLTTAELAGYAGVSVATLGKRSREVRRALHLVPLDPLWTRRSLLLKNPLMWMVEVDGVPVDARDMPRAMQEEALQHGAIPFLPGPHAEGEAAFEPAFGAALTAAPSAPFDGPFDGQGLPGSMRPEVLGAVLADLGAAAGQLFAANPDATDDDLEATVLATVGSYNKRPQQELGGLSPEQAFRLLNADWDDATGPVYVETAIGLAELDASDTLHDARLLLALLEEAGVVRATSTGNLPRTLVTTFLERMRPDREARPARDAAPRPRNEEDVRRLFIARLLLELAGLMKRRKGACSATRRGAQLAREEHAGELLALLIRVYFRKLNLAWLDGMPAAPPFQGTVAFTLFQLGRRARKWSSTAALVPDVLIGAAREAVVPDPYGDLVSTMLELRCLEPLVGFGLAEMRASTRGATTLISPREFRVTPLFDRVLHFELPD